jgi:phage terminase large subunit GpA-like protein
LGLSGFATRLAELEGLLLEKWKHPLGGQIATDAMIVDSGDGQWTPAVYAFCFPRANRKVMAGKGMGGSRPEIEASKTKMQGGGRLWVLGVDVIKAKLLDRVQRDQAIHFSNTLPAVWYEQLCAERKVTRYFKGRPVRRFEVISGRRNEALDCVVQAIAARAALKPNFEQVTERLKGRPVKQKPIGQMFAHARRSGEVM